jgi:hypothetical protein
MLIDADNKCAGWAKLESAAVCGEPFAVEVADDVLALDCDDEAIASHLFSIANELKRSGLVPVVVNSGQPGHLHLFCRVDDPERLAGCKNMARDARLDVREGDCRIRPPLSPHRLACPVSLATNHSPIEALRALSPKPAVRRVPTAMMRKCLTGKNTGPDKSRSALLLSCARSARANGWTAREAFDWLLAHPGTRMAERLSEEKDGWLYWFRHVWNHPGYNPIRDQHALAETIESVRMAAAELCGDGRAGRARLKAFHAHCSVAWKAGDLKYGLSDRQLSELMGVSLPTARKHNRWLIACGLVTREEKGMAKWASVYRISERILKLCTFTGHPPTKNRPVGIGKSMRITPAHDVWDFGALGEAGQLVFSVLDDDEAKSVEEIHRAARCSLATAYRKLAFFEDLGLATKIEGMWLRNPMADLDYVAVVLGTSGRTIARKELHAAQRSYYRERKAHAPSHTPADVQRHDAPGEGDGGARPTRVLHIGAPRDRDERPDERGRVLAEQRGT